MSMPKPVPATLLAAIVLLSVLNAMPCAAADPKPPTQAAVAANNDFAFDLYNCSATCWSMAVAVAANNDFAFDLYHKLATGNADKNVFFSPYSISVALAMTAEGARGATADEMGKVLRYPDAARVGGDQAAQTPWRMSLIHEGVQQINRSLNSDGGDPAKAQATREQIAALRKRLDAVNKEAAALEAAQKWNESQQAARKSAELAKQINQLAATVDQYELRVANALWGEQTYPFLPAYIDTIKEHYDTGGVFNVDYKNAFPAARQRINDWTAEQTNQRIKDIIPDMPAEQAKLIRLILTNAIYFKGEWSTPFDAAKTNDGDFTLAAGQKATVPIMHAAGLSDARYAAFNADGSFFDTPRRIPAFEEEAKKVKTYPAADGFAMVELPYKGDALSMVIIAPNSPVGLPAIEKQLVADKLNGWIAKLAQREVNVNLPRFKLETDYKLADTLKAMGMVRAFTDPGADPANGADFSGMTASADPDDRLYIGAVLHKAFVEVNEKGTEAAAATAVIMFAATSAPIDQPFTPTFNADRPFLFLIREKSTGSVLFLGRITNPASK